MAHRKYKVKQGGGADPKNRELKQERKDPNVLLTGDVVYVREKEEKEESCAAKQRHRFRRKGVPEKLIIQFKRQGEPRADEEYTLDIDGSLSDGKTDGDGKVEVTIPPNARKGKIVFREAGDAYDLDLGNLDPVTEVAGVQGRLRNLGFYAGAVNGKNSPELELAIRSFQEAEGLKITGKPDDSTRKKIEDAYGG